MKQSQHDKILEMRRRSSLSRGSPKRLSRIFRYSDGGVTGDGNADSPTQSASMGGDAGLTKGVSGTGPGDATGQGVLTG